MSQSPYSAVSQGPVTIPMQNYGGEQHRITPAPQNWCTKRRTIVIVAIVILTLLWLFLVIMASVGQLVLWAALSDAHEELYKEYSYKNSES